MNSILLIKQLLDENNIDHTSCREFILIDLDGMDCYMSITAVSSTPDSTIVVSVPTHNERYEIDLAEESSLDEIIITIQGLISIFKR